MRIKSIHSDNHNKFFQDKYLNKLVDLSLENLENDVFLNIITLIKLPNLENIKNIIPQFKLDPDCEDISVYDEILSIFNEIYNEKEYANIKGSFLELLTFKFINRKYDVYKSDFDCYVELDGVKSDKTVDVFALCINLKGFICECKLSHINFKDYHLSNLNNIFKNSNDILLPYIITFSNRELIRDKLITIVKDDDTNSDVYLGLIKIISNNNLSDFFVW